MNMSTNDVYYMLGYNKALPNMMKLNDIYNQNVPIGNQYTVDDHLSMTSGYNRDLNSGKLYRRFDYHTGDHAEFMAFCHEMHINYDNDTGRVKRENKEGYTAHINDMEYYLNKTFFEKLVDAFSSFKPSTRYIPRRWKWMQYEYDKMVTHEGYVGLSNDQVDYMMELRKQVGYIDE